ncbi:MAG TPA: hypothetical protein VEY93_00065, partial [Longimicrobium sp.]|nr:hypothetical protein [Longimicrobium sp.]
MNMFPAAVADLSQHVLFSRKAGEDTWILGNVERDRYITVPGPVLPVLSRAAQLLDGSRSEETVQRQIREELGRDLDVKAFTQTLRSAGLLRSSPESLRKPGDLPAITIATLPLTRTSQKGATIRPALLLVACAIPLLLTVAHTDILAAISGSPGVQMAVAALLSMLLHEGGHAAAAVGAGLKPKSLTLALYLGFIPMLYLRIPGLYTLSPRGRIIVWSAGCAVNVAIAAGCYAWATAFPGSRWAVFIASICVWNLALVKLNLLPFLPTDGYFIVSTLLREHNLRGQAHRVVAGWLRGRGAAVRAWVGLYALLTVGVTIRFAMFAGGWLATHVPAP